MNSAIISSISQTLYIIHITISLINTFVSTKVKSFYFEFGGFVFENLNKSWVQLFGAECWSYFWAIFYWNSVVRAFNSCCKISLPLANVWCQEYFVTSKIMSQLVHLVSVLIYLLLTILIICIRMTFVQVVWWGEPETIIILTPSWHWIKITCHGPGSMTQCLIYILCFSCINRSVYLPPLRPCSMCSLSCLSCMLVCLQVYSSVFQLCLSPLLFPVFSQSVS